jgi:glycosyltransferase involved in cell wall biosynthesis
MNHAPAIDARSIARPADILSESSSSPSTARVVLLQTQAEAAGAQEISRILGQGLEAKGYDVHHVFFFRRTAAFDQQPNTFFCAPERPTGLFGLVRMSVALVRHLKRLCPDAVLCFQHYGNIMGAVGAKLAGIEMVVANRTSAKSLVPRWAKWTDLMFGCTGLFKRVVVNSRAVEEEYSGYPRGYRSQMVRIEHGFATKTSSLSRAEARRSLDLHVDAILLGCVARLHPGKNLAAAIRLLPFDRDWHLALAGQGAEREQLLRLATDLGVADRVHFVGELSPDRISAFLRALDVFVFPTLAETFGLAAVEAAQAGVPVVANDLAVLREVLAVDGRPCALFVDAADAGTFADAVRRLLADKDLAMVLSARGRNLSKRYSLGAMVDQYAALIEGALPQSVGGEQP